MKKLLIFISIALILAGLSGCVKENEMAEPVIFVKLKIAGVEDYEIWTFDKDGAYVGKFTAPKWNQKNNICVDSANNVYLTDVAGGSWNVIKKWDKNGTLLKSKTTDWTEGIAIGPDGYLYTRQLGNVEFGESFVIVKRDPDTLEAVSHIVWDDVEQCFTFDPDGYFYIRDKVDGEWGIAKWDYDTETRKAFHTAYFGNNWASFAFADSLLGFCWYSVTCPVCTMPSALDEDQTDWSVMYPIHIAAIDNSHFIVVEAAADNYYKIRKYTSAGSLVWEANIEHEDNVTVHGVGVYPFRREEAQPIIALIG